MVLTRPSMSRYCTLIWAVVKVLLDSACSFGFRKFHIFFSIIFSSSVHGSDFCIPATTTSGRQNLRFAFSRSHLFCACGLRWGQWTDHLEQSAACTTSTRAVTERLHMCTENAVVIRSRYQTTFEIRRVLLTVFVVTWKLFFSHSASIHSTLGASRLCAIQIQYWHWHCSRSPGTVETFRTIPAPNSLTCLLWASVFV